MTQRDLYSYDEEAYEKSTIYWTEVGRPVITTVWVEKDSQASPTYWTYLKLIVDKFLLRQKYYSSMSLSFMGA